MRMRMINPKIMCKVHLSGEHNEIHKFHSSFVRGYSIAGRYGQIEPLAMRRRHNELAQEMLNRGWNHESPYEQPDLSHYSEHDKTGKVNMAHSIQLIHQCPGCFERMLNNQKH